MKRRILLTIASVLFTFALGAQVRTENDIDEGNFILGAEGCVICEGDGASLQFSTKGFVFEAIGSGLSVSVKDLQTGKSMNVLSGGTLSVASSAPAPSVGGDAIVSLAWHDFTGDNNPELVIAIRSTAGLTAYILEFSSSSWHSVGTLNASGVEECRIFRQVITMRDSSADTLHTWTWRNNNFDYRANK